MIRFSEFLERSFIKSTKLIALGIKDVINANNENDLTNKTIEITDTVFSNNCVTTSAFFIALSAGKIFKMT